MEGKGRKGDERERIRKDGKETSKGSKRVGKKTKKREKKGEIGKERDGGEGKQRERKLSEGNVSNVSHGCCRPDPPCPQRPLRAGLKCVRPDFDTGSSNGPLPNLFNCNCYNLLTSSISPTSKCIMINLFSNRQKSCNFLIQSISVSWEFLMTYKNNRE